MDQRYWYYYIIEELLSKVSHRKFCAIYYTVARTMTNQVCAALATAVSLTTSLGKLVNICNPVVFL